MKRIGAAFIRAFTNVQVALDFWGNRYQNQIIGTSPGYIGPVPVEQDYFADFTAASPGDVLDLAGMFSWPVATTETWLKEWQIDATSIPEQIAAWRTGMVTLGLDGWLFAAWVRFAYQSAAQVNLTISTDQGASVTIAIPPSTEGVPNKYFTWIPAISNGAPMKFRMLEFTADAGGNPWTCFAKDIELAVRQWGENSPLHIIRPFSGVGFGVPGSTT